MNISVQMIVIVTAACLCVAHAAPDMRGRTKQQRPTRGFKNVEMMTARGFGKRDRPIRRTTHVFVPRNVPMMTAQNYGKRNEVYGEQPEETLWETLEQPGEMDPNDSRDEKQDSVKSMKTIKSGGNAKTGEKKRNSKSIVSITVDTFTKEMLRNPEFAKTVVRRFIDRNLDGFLTEDELLKANI